MALIIRRLHPVIDSKVVKKKQKPARMYKENRQRAYRAKETTNEPLVYAYMTEKQKQKLKDNSITHSLRATKGLTPKMRTIRRRRRKEYLRIKYKLRNLTKVCTICHTLKALSDFDFQKDSTHKKRYRRTYCYICRKDMNAAAYQQRKSNKKGKHDKNTSTIS